MLGGVLTGVWVFVFFPLIETRSFPLITLAMRVGLGFWSLTYGPIGAM